MDMFEGPDRNRNIIIVIAVVVVAVIHLPLHGGPFESEEAHSPELP
jgi:hypothetical protein